MEKSGGISLDLAYAAVPFAAWCVAGCTKFAINSIIKGHPAFGVAVALAFIVILDANSLRRQIGR